MIKTAIFALSSKIQIIVWITLFKQSNRFIITVHSLKEGNEFSIQTKLVIANKKKIRKKSEKLVIALQYKQMVILHNWESQPKIGDKNKSTSQVYFQM